MAKVQGTHIPGFLCLCCMHCPWQAVRHTPYDGHDDNDNNNNNGEGNISPYIIYICITYMKVFQAHGISFVFGLQSLMFGPPVKTKCVYFIYSSTPSSNWYQRLAMPARKLSKTCVVFLVFGWCGSLSFQYLPG